MGVSKGRNVVTYGLVLINLIGTLMGHGYLPGISILFWIVQIKEVALQEVINYHLFT